MSELHTPSGRNGAVPLDGFIPAVSQAGWRKKRKDILNAMQEVMGPLPDQNKRCPLMIKVEEEADCGSYLRRLISYASEPGSRTPAYLLIPKQNIVRQLACPAALCLHPTDDLGGHKVVVGLTSKIHRNYASELAERGFVTLAPAYPLLANYQPDLKALGYQSGTMKAIWDNIRGLDLLASLPNVKADAIAAIGHSLGGHNSVYTAVFDPRIKIIVSSCGLDSYKDYKNGDITGWTSERYMPNLKRYQLSAIPFDFHDLISALAPRPCLIIAPINDSNFKWQSVDKVVSSASQIYALYNASDNLIVKHPECAHDFPDDMREYAYKFIENHLPTIN